MNPSAKPRLSVCWIVRNEAVHLRRSLASVQAVADELVVADTGSTDDSREVARAAGAKVTEFPWCDDFAAARNHAVAQATGDWILWLDADEELLPESHAELRGLLAQPDLLGAFVRRHDLHSLGPPPVGTWMQHLRLFRNDPALRFRGRCHPDFVPPAGEIAARQGRRISESDLRLRHYGYLEPGNERAKLGRGVRLMRLELADRPGQLYYEIELGRTLLVLGDAAGHELLRAAARRLLAERHRAQPPLPLAALLLEYLLVTPAAVAALALPVTEIEALALRWFPRGGPLLWHVARRRYDGGDFQGCRSLLEQLVILAEQESYDQIVSFAPRILGDDLRLNLGACCVRLGDLAAAERHFRAIPSASRLAPAAAQNLAAIARVRSQAGATAL